MVKSPKGKLLFGGGGITPDYFIAADTTNYGKEIAKLIYGNVLSQFAIQYYQKNKAAIAAFKTASNFSNLFQLNDTDWKQIELLASIDSIQLKDIKPAEKKLVIDNIKSTLAKMQWDKNGYYQTLQVSDDYIQKSMSLLNAEQKGK
jgi:carboxyl-terminal processing protease